MKIDFNDEKNRRAKIILHSEDTLSTFEILNYFTCFFRNYVKIYLLEAMSLIYLHDANTTFHIYYETRFSKNYDKLSNMKKLITDLQYRDGFDHKNVSCNFIDSKDLYEFFQCFKKHEFPMIFCAGNKYRNILYDYFDRSSILVREISYNSPPSFDISGLLGIIDLLIRQPREIELHRLEQENLEIEQGKLRLERLIKNLELSEKVASVSKLLDDPNTNMVVKNYLSYQLAISLEEQAKITKALCIQHIDKKI